MKYLICLLCASLFISCTPKKQETPTTNKNNNSHIKKEVPVVPELKENSSIKEEILKSPDETPLKDVDPDKQCPKCASDEITEPENRAICEEVGTMMVRRAVLMRSCKKCNYSWEVNIFKQNIQEIKD